MIDHSQSPVIVWFRSDLRLEDNKCIEAACKEKKPILFLYIWAPFDEGSWAPGKASKWWLKQSLLQLQESLKSKGCRLILRHGSAVETLQNIIKETDASALFFSRRYEPASIAIENQVKSELRKQAVKVESFNNTLLIEPWEVAKKSGEPFAIFTPYYGAWQKLEGSIEAPSPAMPTLTPFNSITSDSLDCIEGASEGHWASPIQPAWNPGEKGAKLALNHFLKESLENYIPLRDRPDLSQTSHLSAHLHYGELSIRTLFQALAHLKQKNKNHVLDYQIDSYIRQLCWREFAYQLLFHNPESLSEPMHTVFKSLKWNSSKISLQAWQQGQTGYPIVDAAMRELLYSGWMHNRARLIAASFLVKHLLQPWQEGSIWFWNHLVDADLSNNTLGWQWISGCGFTAAPFFRIFNPILQARKFDPEGHYVRTWIPELKHLPKTVIHTPWLAPAQTLKQANVELGINYPYPIVEHTDARARALQAYAEINQKVKKKVSL